jgi:hypothetical protein
MYIHHSIHIHQQSLYQVNPTPENSGMPNNHVMLSIGLYHHQYNKQE